MSENTVRKYIRQLEEQELLFTEPTEIMTRAGQKRNRNLHHTLRPTQEVVNAYYDRQLARLEITVMRQKAAAAQAGMWAAVCGGDSVGRVQAFRVGTVCRSSRY